MDYQQAKYTFEKMVMLRWPTWNPNEVQKADWIATLRGFDWNEVKAAVYEYVQNCDMFTSPKLNVMVKFLRKHADIRQRQHEKPKAVLDNVKYLTIEDRRQLKLKILDGPDTPAKRFLLGCKQMCGSAEVL